MWMSWNIFRQNDLFDPCDPDMTFEVKLLIAFVATHPLVILTKIGQNPIKHVKKKQIVRRKRSAPGFARRA